MKAKYSSTHERPSLSNSFPFPTIEIYIFEGYINCVMFYITWGLTLSSDLIDK